MKIANSPGDKAGGVPVGAIGKADAVTAEIRDVMDDYTSVRREVRSWAFWLIGLGVIHLVAAGFLNAPWGILLIIAGLGSFYFKEAAMLIPYGVILLWAAISNLLGGGAWAIFALVQIYFAIRVFRQTSRLSKAEARYRELYTEGLIEEAPPPIRAAGTFPWLGMTLSVIGLGIFLGMVFRFASGIFADETSGSAVLEEWAYSGAINLGVLGFALSLSALVSGHKNRAMSTIGIIVGAVILIMFVATFLLGS
jgi:hypothetical protein